jgi:hypothetical protein
MRPNHVKLASSSVSLQTGRPNELVKKSTKMYPSPYFDLNVYIHYLW